MVKLLERISGCSLDLIHLLPNHLNFGVLTVEHSSVFLLNCCMTRNVVICEHCKLIQLFKLPNYFVPFFLLGSAFSVVHLLLRIEVLLQC